MFKNFKQIKFDLLGKFLMFCTENWRVGGGDPIFHRYDGQTEKIKMPRSWCRLEVAVISFPGNEEFEPIKIELYQS